MQPRASFASLAVGASLFTLTSLLLACGGVVADGSGVPDGPLPTATSTTCDEGGVAVRIMPLVLIDNHTTIPASNPLYARFSPCPTSSAVRIEYPTSFVTVATGKAWSVLTYGPGYLPTRGVVYDLAPAMKGLAVSVGAQALSEDVWRSRLPRHRADAPTLVVLVGVLGMHGVEASPKPACDPAGSEVRVVDAPSAALTYLGPAPSYAVSKEARTSSSGIVVVDGLVAGATPVLEVTPATGCGAPIFPKIAPLENGVVSLGYVGFDP
jgi:hypothetical protein